MCAQCTITDLYNTGCIIISKRYNRFSAKFFSDNEEKPLKSLELTLGKSVKLVKVVHIIFYCIIIFYYIFK